MKQLLLALFSLAFAFAFSQNEASRESGWGPLVGYQQFKYSFVEAGLAKIHWSTDGALVAWSYGATAEFGVNEKVYGVKSFIRYGGGVNVGFNLIYYGEYETGNQNTLRFRPEIGIGSGFVNLVYGYNLPLIHSDFNAINTHAFSLHFILAPKMLKRGLL